MIGMAWKKSAKKKRADFSLELEVLEAKNPRT
jgi:hypothetical protein